MENSRNTPSVDLVHTVLAALRGKISPGARVVVGLSGGLDSVTLLHAALECANTLRFSLRAVHVNHGLSANATSWAEFCKELCARLSVPLSIELADLTPHRRLGREGAARAARWAALASHQWDFLLLAHHQDDQAETVLLRLLRGAGTAGLAGMARVSSPIGSRTHGAVLRPFLDTPRAAIHGFAKAKEFDWIDDESNWNEQFERNFLRHRILPALDERFAHASASLARSAKLLEEAGALLDELASDDLERARGDGFLDLGALKAMGEARARNTVRGYLRSRGIPIPGYHLQLEIWRQLCESKRDSAMCVRWNGFAARRYRNRLYVEALPELATTGAGPWQWDGGASLPLLELGGELRFRPEEGRGVSLEKLKMAPVTIRIRAGGERLKLAANRPSRSLKNLWQERAIPPWQRDRRPLIYCGEELVSVPGLGDAWQWRAGAAERGLITSWQPFDY